MLNQHQTIRDNIARFNKPNSLVDYLLPLVKGKDKVKILDVGSGPYSTIGHYIDGVQVELTLCDNQDFTPFWEKYNAHPIYEIEQQDMENLTYPDDFFDVVHCANALDHTNNALRAVGEMVRVCKPGGWIYIDCHLDQLNTGHKHKWNAQEDGTFTNGNTSFSLKDFGFSVKYINNGGERRYNKIIARRQK